MYTQEQMKKLSEIDTKIANAVKKLNVSTIAEAKNDGVDIKDTGKGIAVSRNYNSSITKEKYKRLAV